MNVKNFLIGFLLIIFNMPLAGATLRTYMYDPSTSNTSPSSVNFRGKSLELTGTESGISVFTAATSGKKLAFSVPDTLAEGTTNKFSFSNPSAGQIVGIHSYSAGIIVWTNLSVSAGTNNPVTLEGPQNTIIANQMSRSQWSTNQSFTFSLAVGASNKSSITYTKLENTSTNTIYASNSFTVFSKRDGSNVSVFPILPSSSLDLYSYLDASNVWNVITYGAEFKMLPDGTTAMPINDDSNITEGVDYFASALSPLLSVDYPHPLRNIVEIVYTTNSFGGSTIIRGQTLLR